MKQTSLPRAGTRTVSKVIAFIITCAIINTFHRLDNHALPGLPAGLFTNSIGGFGVTGRAEGFFDASGWSGVRPAKGTA